MLSNDPGCSKTMHESLSGGQKNAGHTILKHPTGTNRGCDWKYGRWSELAKLKGQLFARLALDYFDHPKIMSLSAEAIVAHLEMIVYSRKYGTDGAIPMRFAMRFADHVLDVLANNDPEKPSIIRNDDGTVTIYGYSDMQETSEQIAERRQKRREAGVAGANARWQKDGKSHGKPDGKTFGKKMAET